MGPSSPGALSAQSTIIGDLCAKFKITGAIATSLVGILLMVNIEG